MKVWWPGFDVQLVLLQATGSFSSGNLSAFSIIGSKAHYIIVTTGNEEVARGNVATP